MLEFITPYLDDVLKLVIGGVCAWFLKSRSDKLDIAEKEIKFYREMVDDLTNRLRESISSTNELEKKVDDLTNRLRESISSSKLLEEKVETLTTELLKYKQLNGKTV